MSGEDGENIRVGTVRGETAIWYGDKLVLADLTPEAQELLRAAIALGPVDYSSKHDRADHRVAAAARAFAKSVRPSS
jgi:hypothetical protein